MLLTKILKKEKIYYEKNSIKYSNFNKIIFFGKYNKLKCFVKVFTNKKTFKMFYNEIEGYNFFKKKKFFKLPKIYKFIDNKNYKIIIFEKIIDKKKKFKLFKNISFEKLNSKEKKLSELEFLNKKIFSRLRLNNFYKKFKDHKIQLKSSHGDFLHYNIIKSTHSNYLIDFEYFSKNRSYFHDDLNWYFSPIINFLYNKNFLKINLISFFLYYILNFITFCLYIKKFKQINLKENKIYIIIFIFEKIKILHQDLNICNTNKINLFKLKLCFKLVKKFLTKI